MKRKPQRRVVDTLEHLGFIVTPLLLAIVIYFVKPVFDAVPAIAQKQEVMAVQQQAIANQVGVVSAKQETLDARLVVVQGRVEVLNEKVANIERATK